MGEAAKKNVPPRVETACLAHGKRYYKELTGCYAGEPEEDLQERKADLERKWELLTGASLRGGDGHPLHTQVEYLEAILSFELDPPCGCDPSEIPEGFDD